MNSFVVKAKDRATGEWITLNAVYPYRFGELLDERLDEAYVTVINDMTEQYSPLTEFQIDITDTNGNTVEHSMIVARDDAQKILLSGKTKHTIYLLERTKLLEGILCPSLTFTNISETTITNSARYSLPDEIYDWNEKLASAPSGEVGIKEAMEVLLETNEQTIPRWISSNYTFPAIKDMCV